MRFAFTPVRASLQSPLGTMTLAAHRDALVGVWFDGQRHQPDSEHWPSSSTEPVLRAAAHQLQQYFARERIVFDLPLDWSSGTAFQQQVWRQLLGIAAGGTLSYSTLAQQLGHAMAARAVAGAIARNPLCVVLPCHRVLGARGALTGYAGGVERKAALLQLEASYMQNAKLHYSSR